MDIFIGATMYNTLVQELVSRSPRMAMLSGFGEARQSEIKDFVDIIVAECARIATEVGAESVADEINTRFSAPADNANL